MKPCTACDWCAPAPSTWPQYRAALQRGWSADNLRGAAAAREELERIATDATGFLARMDDPGRARRAGGLARRVNRARVPSLRRWMWLPGSDGGHFAGSIGLRWTKDGAPLPPHVLGHIGYAVVPWQQRRGHATRALALMLPLARERGLTHVEITTDPDNARSQKVILANGGVLVETFDKGAAYGHAPGLRYRIELRP